MFDQRNPIRTLLSVFVMTISLSTFAYQTSIPTAWAFQSDDNSIQGRNAQVNTFPRTRKDLETLSSFFQKLQNINGKLIHLVSQLGSPDTADQSARMASLWAQAKKVYLPGISSACARISAERSLEELRRNILLVRSIKTLSQQDSGNPSGSGIDMNLPIYQITEARFISEYSHMFQSYGCLGFPKSGVNPETWSIRGPLALSSKPSHPQD
ncbi:MAG: hypothetical protein ACYCYP_05720 [Leptospirales bacterium]